MLWPTFDKHLSENSVKKSVTKTWIRYILARSNFLGAGALLAATSLNAGQVNLEWADNSHNELGFFVERRESGGEFTQIGTTGPDVNTFADDSVIPDVMYEYRVNAYNSFGVSGYTNVATTLIAANEAPTIITIDDISVIENSPVSPISFSVIDPDTAAIDLQFAVSSSNQNLVRDEELFVTSESGNLQIRLNPVDGAIGTTTLTLAVSDGSNEVAAQFDFNVTQFTAPSGTLEIDSIGSNPRAEEMFEVVLNLADNTDVSEVSFSIDGMPIGSSSVAPYSLETYILDAGTYDVKATVSYTSHSNLGEYQSSVTIEQAPTDIEIVDNLQSISIGNASDAGSVDYDYATDSFRLSDNYGNVRTAGDANLFHFVEARGDSTITARISDFQNWNDETVAGLMIRSSSDPLSAQASVLYRIGKGKVVQRFRTLDGEMGDYGTLASESSGAVYMRMENSDGVVRILLSEDGSNWDFKAEFRIALGEKYYVGLAFGAGDSGSLASAKFDMVTFEGELVDPITDGKRLVSSASIGESSDQGGAYYDATLDSYELFDVTGNIRTGGDSNRFYYIEASGDVSVTAKVSGFVNWNDQTVAGLMVRSTLDPFSSHASSLYRIGAGKVVCRYRADDGEAGDYGFVSSQIGESSYLKLVKQGNSVQFYASDNGESWDLKSTRTVNFGDSFLVGLALGTKDSVEPVSVKFENLKIENL